MSNKNRKHNKVARQRDSRFKRLCKYMLKPATGMGGRDLPNWLWYLGVVVIIITVAYELFTK